MRLVLTEQTTLPIAYGTAPSVPSIVIGAVQPCIPNATKDWIVELLSPGLASGQRLELGAIQPLTSSRDWPVSLVEAKVIGADGNVVEEWLAAIYVVLQFAIPVALHCAPKSLEAQRTTAMPVLMSGRPDSSQDAVCLHDIFKA